MRWSSRGKGKYSEVLKSCSANKVVKIIKIEIKHTVSTTYLSSFILTSSAKVLQFNLIIIWSTFLQKSHYTLLANLA